MEKDKLKKVVADLVNQGTSLSEIQSILQTDYDYKITFFELRLLAAELENVDWSKQKADKETDQEREKEKEKIENELKPNQGGSGKTSIQMSNIKKPGSIANGSVTFASGVTADWSIDQMGRLSLENQSGEPTNEDLQEFQTELQNKLSNM